MNSVVEQRYWDSTWDGGEPVYNETAIPFRDLFDRFLTRGGSCFEIGCYPGNFLVYLARRFGYTVGGIDLTPHVRRMADRFAAMGIEFDRFVEGDFFKFSSPRQFDVVCSFGFVEHFTNFREVIDRHVDLVAPGGKLVISCPNFRGLQYVLRRTLDAENLRRHVVAAMDLEAWWEQLRGHGMRLLYRGYHKTAEFWFESPPSRALAPFRRLTTRAMREINARFDYPNRYTSPYMILIAQRE